MVSSPSFDSDLFDHKNRGKPPPRQRRRGELPSSSRPKRRHLLPIPALHARAGLEGVLTPASESGQRCGGCEGGASHGSGARLTRNISRAIGRSSSAVFLATAAERPNHIPRLEVLARAGLDAAPKGSVAAFERARLDLGIRDPPKLFLRGITTALDGSFVHPSINKACPAIHAVKSQTEQ